MATLDVFAGGFTPFDIYDATRDLAATTRTSTQLVFASTSSRAALTVTGTGLTYNASGDLTGGTITGLSYKGFEGTLLFAFDRLSLSAAQFQSAADSYAAGGASSTAAFEALFRTQAYVSTGNVSNDALAGGDLADRLNGSWGEDTLVGYAGNDVLTGGPLTEAPDNEAEVGFDFDTVDYSRELGTLGVSVDLTKATGQVRDTYGDFDTLSGIEFIIGTSRSDTFKGTNTTAVEQFTGREGNDVINGGGGLLDIVRYDRESGASGVNANLATGVAIDSYGGRDRLIGIELLRGTARNDTFVGNAGDNNFRAYAGADTINGGAGVDTASYIGDQFLRDLNGFTGSRSIRAVLDDDGTGVARDGFGTVDTLIAIENIRGSDFGDRIVGNNLNNTFDGEGGFDYLDGRAGNDQLLGEGGNDLLLGGLGVDSLDGGLAADVLNGGAGRDVLTGGLGYDAFAFDALGTANVDRIVDFTVADDQIQVENAVFTALPTEGVLAAAAFRIGTAAADANDRIVYNSTTGALLYDADGSGSRAAVQFATLDAGLALTSADVLVI